VDRQQSQEPAAAWELVSQEGYKLQNQERSPLQPVHNLKPYKRVQGTHQVERFFRVAAGLDVDKEDIRRYYEFVDQKVIDLLLMAQHTAKAMTEAGLSRTTFRLPKDFRRIFTLLKHSIWISDSNAS
jgi:Domain of unknown function (DUF1931)